MRGQCPGSYTDVALKERTPAKRVPTRKPACQQAWIEICHGDLSVLFGRDYAAQPRARAVARIGYDLELAFEQAASIAIS